MELNLGRIYCLLLLLGASTVHGYNVKRQIDNLLCPLPTRSTTSYWTQVTQVTLAPAPCATTTIIGPGPDMACPAIARICPQVLCAANFWQQVVTVTAQCKTRCCKGVKTVYSGGCGQDCPNPCAPITTTVYPPACGFTGPTPIAIPGSPGVGTGGSVGGSVGGPVNGGPGNVDAAVGTVADGSVGSA